LKLFDKKLFEARHKHAAIRVAKTHVDQEGSSPAPYISGTGSIYFSLGQPSISWVSTVDWYTQIGFYSLIAVVVTVIVVYYIRYKGSVTAEGGTGTGGERSPLISRSTGTGAVELSHSQP
jgi:membrane protein implicated in regulation of membrane protease activity